MPATATRQQAPVAPITAPIAPDWRARAVAEYQRGRGAEAAALRDELVARLGRLTERAVPPANVYVNVDERRATVAVDGQLFRLEGGELTLLVPGVAELRSPPIRDRADLGYALSVWAPLALHGPVEDPAELG